MRRLFTVGVDTGVRVEQILRLTLRDLDWVHEMIHRAATKGNKRQSLPMTKAAHAALTKVAKGKMSHAAGGVLEAGISSFPNAGSS